MEKIRVSDLAKELELKSSVLLDKLKQMEIQAKSPVSRLTPEDVERIRQELQPQGSAKVAETRVKSNVIRRRAKPKEVVAAPPPPVIEEKAEPEEVIEEKKVEPVIEEPVVEDTETEKVMPLPEMKVHEFKIISQPDPKDLAKPSAPVRRPVRSGSGGVEFKLNTGAKPSQTAKPSGARLDRTYIPPRSKRKRGAPIINKDSKKTELTTPKAAKRMIKLTGGISVGDLAKRMGVKANVLMKSLISQGMMVTINQQLDQDTATLVAADFGYEVENVAFDENSLLGAVQDTAENTNTRPPVVTIVGHVDHGKTSLLDAIRETSVAAREAGGITQHIGAYQVSLPQGQITFLDTPGHAAFTAMRARGVQATDIVVLVVAADDGVMPQTREAIDHAKAADVPIVIAINKIDKEDANPERIKQAMAEFELVPEEWGGSNIFVEISAKEKINLDKLLEMLLLQAEVLELKANPNKRAKGVVVESKLDRGRGPVATVLVQEGTLKAGDLVIAGLATGRVRAMQDDTGKRIKEAGPSMPVEVQGLDSVPQAGDMLYTMADERDAKLIIDNRQYKHREKGLSKEKVSLQDLYSQIEEGEIRELRLIVKADVQGSVGAVKDSFAKLSTDQVKVNVIHADTGGINESDVMLASASNAIIIGFNVRPDANARTTAEREQIDIQLYSIIYEAVDDIKKAMEGLLAPKFQEQVLGHAEVREIFKVSKVGTIAGCYVIDGKINRASKVRLLRESVVVYEGELDSLKRFKDDAKEVATGFECGMSLSNYNDIKQGDVFESFTMQEVKQTLEQAASSAE